MKILWLSNSLRAKTGYGIQSRYILKHLNEDYEVYSLGLQTPAAPMTIEGITELPIFESKWGKKALPYWLEKLEPDLFFSLMDIWVKEELIKIGRKYENFIPYLPVDSAPLPPRSQKILQEAMFLVPFSKFAEELIKDAGFSNVKRIPHGIDVEAYHPLSKEKINGVRKKLGEDVGIDLKNKFIILSVGMNTGFRKGFSRLMEAVSNLIEEGYEDLVLWIHSNPEAGRGVPLYHYARQIGLEINEEIVFSPACGTGRPWSTEAMNELYNMADIHSLASLGEGFALTVPEAQACETPSVVTDFSATPEHIGDNERGLLADTATWWMTPLGSKQELVSVDSLKEQIKKYYENRDLIEKHGEKGRKFVEETYAWNEVFPLWDGLIEEELRPLVE